MKLCSNDKCVKPATWQVALRCESLDGHARATLELQVCVCDDHREYLAGLKSFVGKGRLMTAAQAGNMNDDLMRQSAPALDIDNALAIMFRPLTAPEQAGLVEPPIKRQ